MKYLVIFPSIRATENFGKYAANFTKFGHNPDKIIIDETDENREEIQYQFNKYDQFCVEFFGVEERREWFDAYGLGDPDNIIPRRAHNETSFGLLVALKRDYDMILFADDDTYPYRNVDFIGEHAKALWIKKTSKYLTKNNWANTFPLFFVRGFPYNCRKNDNSYKYVGSYRKPVLNMGCWNGIPDLNAVDYLCYQPSKYKTVFSSFILDTNVFAPICSMNLSFKPEIIPAFYQLWHKDRYDDIFSGLFLKRIADHLGKHIRVGNPVCVHDKVPRNLFDDIRAELQGMEFNEELWKVLLKIEFDEESWLGCYRELSDKLYKNYRGGKFDDYVWVMTQKMRLWTDIMEKLK